MGTRNIMAAIASQFRNRGKLALAGLASAILVGFFAFMMVSQQPWSTAVASEDVDSAGDYDQIVVQPGDTLWSISARLSDDREQLVILEQILTYNGLVSSDLEVGQTLYVPITE